MNVYDRLIKMTGELMSLEQQNRQLRDEVERLRPYEYEFEALLDRILVFYNEAHLRGVDISKDQIAALILGGEF